LGGPLCLGLAEGLVEVEEAVVEEAVVEEAAVEAPGDISLDGFWDGGVIKPDGRFGIGGERGVSPS